jgi:hypothetical protein
MRKNFEWTQVANTAQKNQVITCQDIFSAQTRGDKFIWERLLVDNAIFTGTIALRDPSKFVDSSGYDLLAYQYAATNFNAFFGALVGKRLIKSQWGYFKRQGTRLGLGLASHAIQGLMGAAMLSEHDEHGTADQRARDIAFANMLWTLPALLKGDLVDRVLLKHAPAWAHNLCLKNSKLSFFVGPGFLRVAERIGTQYAYMMWINFFTGEAI